MEWRKEGRSGVTQKAWEFRLSPCEPESSLSRVFPLGTVVTTSPSHWVTGKSFKNRTVSVGCVVVQACTSSYCPRT